MKILKDAEYEKLVGEKDALQDENERLKEKLQNCNNSKDYMSESIDRLERELKNEEQKHRSDLEAVQHSHKVAKAELEQKISQMCNDLCEAQEKAVIQKIDRRGFEMISRQCYKSVSQVEVEDGNYILTCKHANQYGDIMNLVLPQRMRCIELSQLADLLVPQEFPELTEALRLKRNLDEDCLQIKYLPFVSAYWELEESKDTFSPDSSINFRFAIGLDDKGRALGFLAFVHGEGDLNEQDANQWVKNLREVAQLRVGSESQDQPLYFKYNVEQIYLFHSTIKYAVSFDSCRNEVWNMEATKPEWQSFKKQIDAACKKRWDAYLPGVVIPPVILNPDTEG